MTDPLIVAIGVVGFVVVAGVVGALPGVWLFRRMVANGNFPAANMRQGLADLQTERKELSKQVDRLERERLELSAKVVDLQKEVEHLREQLRQLDGMRNLVNGLVLENMELREQARRRGVPTPAAPLARPDGEKAQLGPLLERRSGYQASLNVVEGQIAKQGGDGTASVALINQRDALRKSLREVEDQIDLWHALYNPENGA